MKTIFEEVETLCNSMIAIAELLEDRPQLPVPSEKMRFFSNELKRISELKPAAPQTYTRKLINNKDYPVLVMCLEQAKERMDELNENSSTYDVVDELKSIVGTLLNFVDSLREIIEPFEQFN